MAGRYLETLFTPEVKAAQAHYYGHPRILPQQPGRDPLGDDEIAFISSRDSFYLGAVTSDGWPYIQHRGGPPGFLKVLSPQQLGFADFKGNRQLLSTGNLATTDRVSLFLMDYPQRTRLKILGQAQVLDATEHTDLAARLTPTPELRTRVERLFRIDVVSFDWNCPQYITPRYTAAEIADAVTPLKKRIVELEARLQEKS